VRRIKKNGKMRGSSISRSKKRKKEGAAVNLLLSSREEIQRKGLGGKKGEKRASS